MIQTATKQVSKTHSQVGVVSHKGTQRRATSPAGGLVRFCVHGPTGKIATSDFSPSEIIRMVQAGLPVQELEQLLAALDVPMERLVLILGISKATLYRRKAEGRLGLAESDRILRLALLMGKAVEVLESEENARRWLKSPQIGLGGAVPLDYSETEVGARQVEDLLGRIEHGVYS